MNDLVNPFHHLRLPMELALSAEEYELAIKMAENYLELANQNKDDWNYGNAIHHANLILGRIFLKKGEVEEAKEKLILASKTPGSALLNSFGPNMTLCKEMLAIDQKEIVVEFIKNCKVFWNMPHANSITDGWIKLILDNEDVSFKSNLAY